MTKNQALALLMEKNHTNRFNALVEEYCPTRRRKTHEM